MDELKIEAENAPSKPSTGIIRVIGALNSMTVEQMELKMEELRAKAWKLWVMDLGQLEHLSSNGIGLFVSTMTDLKKEGVEMVLCRPTARVERLFKITGFASLFKIVPDLDKALEKAA